MEPQRCLRLWRFCRVVSWANVLNVTDTKNFCDSCAGWIRTAPTRLHLVMDNYGTHSHPKVKGWLKRHPRFISHFVPTSSSWLNLVERWFGELTSKRIRRGSFVSVEELTKAIEEFLSAWNDNPRPFVWTATVDSIQEKPSRCRQTLEPIQPGCTLPRRKKQKAVSS